MFTRQAFVNAFSTVLLLLGAASQALADALIPPLPVQLQPFAFSDPVVHGVVRTSDGDYVVVGNFRVADHGCVSFLRLDADFSFKSCASVWGTVRDAAALPGGNVVIGGQFSSVNGTVSSTLVVIGEYGEAVFWPHAVWNAGANNSYVMAPVYAVESDEAGNVYVAGQFQFAGPYGLGVSLYPRNGLAKFSSASGMLVTGFQSSIAGAGLWRLHYRSGKLYAGGFGPHLRRMSATTGALDTWGPVVSCTQSGSCSNPAVMGITSGNDGFIYISGIFDTLDGVPHRLVARLTEAGVVDPTWSPVSALSGRPEGIDLWLDPYRGIYAAMYGCASFGSGAGSGRCGLVRLSTVTGQVDRQFPQAGGYIYAVAGSGDQVLAGGEVPPLVRVIAPVFRSGFD